jgi:hypothetical protein
MNPLFCFKTFFSCYFAISCHSIMRDYIKNESLKRHIKELQEKSNAS